jgi:hypothetical protein
MPIKTGIGVGAAQVYTQPNELVNTYGKLLQEKQKQNQAFSNDIAKMFASYNPDSLHPKDLAASTEAYNKIRLAALNTDNLSNTEQAQFKSQVTQGFQKLAEFDNTAKQFRRTLKSISDDMVANPTRYTIEARNTVEKLGQTPYVEVEDKYKELTPFMFIRKAKPGSLENMITKVREQVFENARSQRQIKKGVAGDQEITYAVITPEQLDSGLAVKLALDDDAKADVEERFTSKYGRVPTDEEKIKFVKETYTSLYPGIAQYNESFKFTEPDKPSQKSATSEEYFNNISTNALRGDQASINALNALGKGKFRYDYVNGKLIFKTIKKTDFKLTGGTTTTDIQYGTSISVNDMNSLKNNFIQNGGSISNAGVVAPSTTTTKPKATTKPKTATKPKAGKVDLSTFDNTPKPKK